MSDETLCRFYQFGHCKFGETCQKFHIPDTCTNFPCLLEHCASRHPPLCKFFARFGKCKFEENCSFIHKNTNSEITKTKEDIKILEKEIESLKAHNIQINTILNIIDQMKDDIDILKRICHANSTEVLFQCDMCNLNCKTSDILIKHIESSHQPTSNVETQFSCSPCDFVGEHENTIEEVTIDEPTSILKFRCDQCEFESESQKGVNIHKGSKHKASCSNTSEVSSGNTFSNTEVSFSQFFNSLAQLPILCTQYSENGCENIVMEYVDKFSAICDTCEQLLDLKQNT